MDSHVWKHGSSEGTKKDQQTSSLELHFPQTGFFFWLTKTFEFFLCTIFSLYDFVKSFLCSWIAFMEQCVSYLFIVICGSIYVCSAHVWKFWLVEKSRLLKSSFCGELEWDAPLAYHGGIDLSWLMLLLYLILFMFLLKYTQVKFAELVASSIYFKMAILCRCKPRVNIFLCCLAWLPDFCRN